MAKKKTKKKYEEWLNTISPPQGHQDWIIGGKIRMLQMWKNEYGSAIRKFDQTRFQVGYNDFLRNNEL
tara:strand:- start:1766 stop:1969 length:204 start_codon:yes stop_codon:yes gene_type:complete